MKISKFSSRVKNFGLSDPAHQNTTILVWEIVECQKMIFEYFHFSHFYYSNNRNELK